MKVYFLMPVNLKKIDFIFWVKFFSSIESLQLAEESTHTNITGACSWALNLLFSPKHTCFEVSALLTLSVSPKSENATVWMK